MLQLARALVLLVLAVTPALAGSILYATAASEQRIDAFCLDGNGRPEPTPNGKSFPTSAIEPRRLLVAEGVITEPQPPDRSRNVLYVALSDRVEAFRISPRGYLESIGSTRAQEFMDPRDLLLSPKRNRLYVAQHGFNRIVVYAIAADGSLVDPREPTDPTTTTSTIPPSSTTTTTTMDSSTTTTTTVPERLASCAIGRGDARYVSLAIGPDPSRPEGALLYASSEGNGRVDIYPLNADGDILEIESNAENTPVLDPATQAEEVPPGVVTCPDERPCGRPKVTQTVSLCKCPEPMSPDPPSSDPAYLYTPASLAERCAEANQKEGERPPTTQPRSSRRGFGQPKSIILDGEMLYVEERYRKRITAFRLKDGLFCNTEAECPGFDTGGSDKCVAKQTRRAANDKIPRQCSASRTHAIVQYEDVVKFGDLLLGTQFFRGRIDAYQLPPTTTTTSSTTTTVTIEPTSSTSVAESTTTTTSSTLPIILGGVRDLPKRPRTISAQDVRMTPVRAVASSLRAIRSECSDTDPARPCNCAEDPCAGVLYVAAGSLDQVVAYDLGANGSVSHEPIGRTQEDEDSFPNDVAVAVLPEECK
jgi:hypothetical protein